MLSACLSKRSKKPSSRGKKRCKSPGMLDDSPLKSRLRQRDDSRGGEAEARRRETESNYRGTAGKSSSSMGWVDCQAGAQQCWAPQGIADSIARRGGKKRKGRTGRPDRPFG